MVRTERKTTALRSRSRIKSGTLASLALASSSLAGLVVFAERLNPIPSRTRPLNFPAPMVLSLKAWKSRSLPGLPRTLASPQHDDRFQNGRQSWRPFFYGEAHPFTTSWIGAPTTAPSCAGEMPSASPQTGGQPIVPLFSNARCGAHRSQATTAIATAPTADGGR